MIDFDSNKRLKDLFLQKKKEKERLEENFKEQKARYEKSMKNGRDLQLALDLCQVVGQSVQQVIHKQISEIVTKCLKEVFGDESYDFKIVFDRERKKTTAKLVFERDGQEIDPMTSSGGGVLDVASFALRLTSIVMQKRKIRKLLILDEPFRFVSATYRSKITKMLEKISKEFGVQIIMVTHIPELVTGNVIKI